MFYNKKEQWHFRFVYICLYIFLSCHIHALTTSYTLTLPWCRMGVICCDQLGYKFLHFTLVCQIKESFKHGGTTKESVTQTGCSRHSQTQCSTQYHLDCWNLAESGSFWCYNLGNHLHWPPSMRWHTAVDIDQW